MHNTATQYHLHYSAVRTVASTVYLSFGILSSILLFISRSGDDNLFPLFLLLLVYITTLGFNVIFVRWSRACRQIERFYEQKIGSGDRFDALYGFRHLFRHILLRRATRAALPPDYPPKMAWTWQSATDPFLAGIALSGSVYIVIYMAFLLGN